MHLLFENYLSVTSLCQLLVALIGLGSVWFWVSVWKGLYPSSTECESLNRHPLFLNPIYRQLFRLHQFTIVRALSFTLAMWPLFIVVEVIPKLVIGRYMPYTIAHWSDLFESFAMSLVLFYLTMRDQGLSLKLDKYLSVSWDMKDFLALHLNKTKVDRLSPEFILLLVESTKKHQTTLSQHGINVSLNIESWLLAPEISRHDPAVKRLRATLDTPNLKSLFLSHSTRHIRYVTIFLCLIIKSPIIFYRINKLPKPTGRVTNGLFKTRYTSDIETAFDTLKPSWQLQELPLKRMTTFSVIALVTHNPKVRVAICGWTGGVRLGELADLEARPPGGITTI